MENEFYYVSGLKLQLSSEGIEDGIKIDLFVGEIDNHQTMIVGIENELFAVDIYNPYGMLVEWEMSERKGTPFYELYRYLYASGIEESRLISKYGYIYVHKSSEKERPINLKVENLQNLADLLWGWKTMNMPKGGSGTNGFQVVFTKVKRQDE